MLDKTNEICFLDDEGNRVYPTEWRSSGIGCWFSGPAKARRNGKWSYIDVSGAYITEDLFDDAEYFHGGVARVKKNGLWGFIDIAGEYISSCQWTYARNLDMEANVAQVSDGENWGFIDITGKLVCPCVWEWMHEDFDCGMVMVMDGKSGLLGFLDPEGKQIGGWLTHYGLYREGLAKVCQNEKWGFVRDSGSLAIPCQWDEVQNFSEGFAAVKQDGKWGYIDRSGTLVSHCKWDEAGDFYTVTKSIPREEVCDAGEDDDFTMTNEEGADICARVKLDGKWGILDSLGKLVVPCRWEFIRSFRKGILTVTENGEEFRVDIQGNRV